MTTTEILIVLAIVAVMCGAIFGAFDTLATNLALAYPDRATPDDYAMLCTTLSELGYTDNEINAMLYRFDISLSAVPPLQQRAILTEKGIDTADLTDTQVANIFENLYPELRSKTK